MTYQENDKNNSWSISTTANERNEKWFSFCVQNVRNLKSKRVKQFFYSQCAHVVYCPLSDRNELLIIGKFLKTGVHISVFK